jgi:predicted transport protein
MSDIKIFKIEKSGIQKLTSKSIAVEKSLQKMMEKNLEVLLGVRFLASEFSTGKVHGGRIDTLGIDENGCPVIMEYKRALNENVINQGLFYLDWLLDHKGDYYHLVLKQLGKKVADEIEWPSPRLLCIAGDFTKYDEHAVQQIGRNIELIRYKHFQEDLLLLELVNAAIKENQPPKEKSPGDVKYTTITDVLEKIEKSNTKLFDLHESIKTFLLSLGDDVQMNTLKYYLAFKRIKNFACVDIGQQKEEIIMYLKINPDDVTLEKGFSRDIRKIGHYGTGDLEITIGAQSDFEKAKPLILKSYEEN